jgi:hypothetical protein
MGHRHVRPILVRFIRNGTRPTYVVAARRPAGAPREQRRTTSGSTAQCRNARSVQSCTRDTGPRSVGASATKPAGSPPESPALPDAVTSRAPTSESLPEIPVATLPRVSIPRRGLCAAATTLILTASLAPPTAGAPRHRAGRSSAARLRRLSLSRPPRPGRHVAPDPSGGQRHPRQLHLGGGRVGRGGRRDHQVLLRARPVTIVMTQTAKVRNDHGPTSCSTAAAR